MSEMLQELNSRLFDRRRILGEDFDEERSGLLGRRLEEIELEMDDDELEPGDLRREVRRAMLKRAIVRRALRRRLDDRLAHGEDEDLMSGRELLRRAIVRRAMRRRLEERLALAEMEDEDSDVDERREARRAFVKRALLKRAIKRRLAERLEDAELEFGEGDEEGVIDRLKNRLSELGEHRGHGPIGFKKSDQRLQDQIGEALSDDSELDARDLEVKVKDGEVTLAGAVASRMARRRAEEIIQRISGVRDVLNQVRVKARAAMEAGNGKSKESAGGTPARSAQPVHS